MRGANEGGKRKEGAGTHPLVELARLAVRTFVSEGATISAPAELAAAFHERAGVFVCIKRRGSLRGCIGTFEATQPSVVEETIVNAISAATADPRFPPVVRRELPSLSYSVDILSPPQRVQSIADLDPRQYGIIVQRGGRRGLLLPNLEGVDTVADQLRITRQKAGIGPEETVELWRFEVRRFE
jgi:AmmeMemoRadiSam system protein A